MAAKDAQMGQIQGLGRPHVVKPYGSVDPGVDLTPHLPRLGDQWLEAQGGFSSPKDA